MDNYIINATEKLKNKKNETVINFIAQDLQAIKLNNPNISSIILRGGAAIDIITGIEPNDIDLFYTYKLNTNNYCSQCKCDEVRDSFKKINFKYFTGKDIDLENAYEKEPKLQPIERTVGLFSYHSDFSSQFAIDEEENVWTNKDALHYYSKGIYEIRYEGFLPWAYFPHNGDSHNYWGFQVYMLIRGIGYITKRGLKPGKKFMRMLYEYKYFIPKAIEETGLTGFQKYASKKIKLKKNFTSFVKDFIEIDQSEDFSKYFEQILVECK